MDAPRVNIAVIGCGYWGKNHVRTCHELGLLAAVSDPDAATAAAFAAQYNTQALPITQILADPNINALIIAAPAEYHYSLAEQALRAGKHILVEKPLALRAREADLLVQMADKAGLTLMVGHILQYHPAFTALGEMVRNGRLGRLQYLYSNRVNLGKIRREENILWSFAPHDISMILALVGSEPHQVSATGSYYLHKTIADVTVTHLEFPSGANAHIFVSWLHPFKEQKLVVVGDQAMAVFDDTRGWSEKLTLYPHRIAWKDGVPTPEKADGETVALQEAEPLKQEVRHFADCILAKTPPRTDGREGLRVLKVLEAAEADMVGGTTMPAAMLPENSNYFAHESAYIDDAVDIGEGSKIWHFCHILSGSRIGRNCVLGQNVMVGPHVQMGDNCKIQNNVSLYDGVQLSDDVFCGPSCVFTNVVNPRAHVNRKDAFRPTPVGRGATIGANATIVCGHEIGAYAMIGAGAVVTKDVAPHALMAGVPARRIGWVSHAGEKLGTDLICPMTARRYREAGPDRLEEILDDG